MRFKEASRQFWNAWPGHWMNCEGKVSGQFAHPWKLWCMGGEL